MVVRVMEFVNGGGKLQESSRNWEIESSGSSPMKVLSVMSLVKHIFKLHWKRWT